MYDDASSLLGSILHVEHISGRQDGMKSISLLQWFPKLEPLVVLARQSDSTVVYFVIIHYVWL